MDLELVTEGLKFPEGPIAMDDGSVILTEIKAGRLTRVSPDGKQELVVETGGGPNGAAIGPDGTIWITTNGSAFEYVVHDGLLFSGHTDPARTGGMIQRFDLNAGKMETVYEAFDGKRLIAPNDLVFDKQGGFWFTDNGADGEDSRRYGGLYYAKPDGSLITRPRYMLITPMGWATHQTKTWSTWPAACWTGSGPST